MNLRNLLLILLVVICMAGGQVLFKLGALASNEPGPATGLVRYANAHLAFALVLYVIATALWIWVLKSVPLNIAYPFMGLAFVLVPLAAALFVGEPLAWQHLVGGLVIAAGIWIVQQGA